MEMTMSSSPSTRVRTGSRSRRNGQCPFSSRSCFSGRRNGLPPMPSRKPHQSARTRPAWHHGGFRFPGRNWAVTRIGMMKLKIGTPAQTQPGWFRPLDLMDYAVDCPPPLDTSAPQLYVYLIKNRNCGNTGCRVVMNIENPAHQFLDVLTGDRV